MREVRGQAGKSPCGSGLGCGAVTAGQVHGDEVQLGSHAGAGGQDLGLAKLETLALQVALGSATRLGAGGSSWPLSPTSALRALTHAT